MRESQKSYAHLKRTAIVRALKTNGNRMLIKNVRALKSYRNRTRIKTYRNRTMTAIVLKTYAH